MSDAQENIEQEVDLEALANAENQEEQQEEIKLSDFEQKQFDQGWRPLDDFTGPEENWKTAKEFQRDGEWLAKLREKDQRLDRIEKDFNDRLENTNKLHEARRDADIKKLKTQQREAVDTQDTDSFDRAQAEIDDLEKQEVKTTTTPAVPNEDPTITAWKAKNSWFEDVNDERGGVAVSIWNSYFQTNPTASNEQALKHIDTRIARLYPTSNENPRRNQPNSTENNTRRASRQSKGLSMSDLTGVERQEWNQFGSMMFTEAEFLKTVADTRTK
jgi:hypothetical protein